MMPNIKNALCPHKLALILACVDASGPSLDT